MKQCSRCGVQKNHAEFSRNTRAKDGLKAACKVCLSADYRAYSQANREKVLAKSYKWAQSNPQKRKATYAKYRESHPDRVKEASRKWEANNYKRRSEIRHRKRANRMANGTCRVTKRDLMRLYAQACFYCGSRDRITADHVLPIARGGRHSIGNLVPACLSCNSQKRHRTVMEWRLAKRVSL